MPCATHPEVLDGLRACFRCRRTFCPDCLVEMKGGLFCGACKGEQVKDIRSGVDSTQLPLAGIGVRFAAHFVDGILVLSIAIPLMFLFGMFDFEAALRRQQAGEVDMTGLIFQIFFSAFYLAYHGIFLQWRGQTLGKMALKIKVVTPDGSDIRPGAAWLRPFVQMILGSCLIDYIPAFFTKNKTAFHDMAAKTRVIKL